MRIVLRHFLACLFALSAAGQTQDRGMSVRSAQEAGIDNYDPSACHALVIGINQYANWPRLRCAANDARSVASALRRRYGYGDVRLLLDEQATRRGILQALDDYARLGERDSVLIYFAGHGWMDDRGNGYWVPCEAPRDDKFSYVSNAQIVQEYFKKYAVRHLLVIADSCFSGSLLRGGETRRAADWKLPAGFQKPSRWVLTSGDLSPVPDDAGSGHSPFAIRVLQFLEHSDQPAFGVQDLLVYVRQNLRTEAMGLPLDTPMHMPGGEYVFFRLDKQIEDAVAPPSAPVPPPATPAGPVAVTLTGALEVRSPESGTVTIDGGQDFRIEPDKALKWNELPVGAHEVVVACAGKPAWRQRVEVREGATATVAASFGAQPGEGLTVDLGGGVKMELVWVEAGEFDMGSDEYDDEKPIHRVRLSRGFWLGKYEVTNGQYQRFLQDSGYDGTSDADSDYLKHFRGGSDMPTGDAYPICWVSWKNAQAFCQWLSRKSGVTVRLPTEAEWEYACRAGTMSRFSSGNSDQDLDRTGWFSGNSGGKTHPVGQKLPNAWGLYDMHGNVWEWCEDWYGDYVGVSATDPTGPSSGSSRVLRGGSWGSAPAFCRSARRRNGAPAGAVGGSGFRVVCVR